MQRLGKRRVAGATGGLLLWMSLVSTVAAPAIGASVAPQLVPGAGNSSCSQFAPAGESWNELKVDPNADGVYSQGDLTVTISNTQNDKTFDWSSNIGVDAVFVKGGSDGSYLYLYSPESTGDTNLTTPGRNAISHISFCWDEDDEETTTTAEETTTTAEETTTTAEETTTTAEETTTTAEEITTTTEDDTEVGGIVVTNPSNPQVTSTTAAAGATASTLPFTGMSTGSMAVVGAALAALGALLLVASRQIEDKEAARSWS